MNARLAHLASALIALFTSSALAQKGPVDLERPGEREFVRDLAGLIEPTDEEHIKRLADELLSDKFTPILVVTIESMARHGGAGMDIDEFARSVFDHWGIGQASVRGHPWNTGILLLVSQADRKARIELGAGWMRAKDVEVSRIMDEQIIPRFRAGDFSGGIVAGVEALDRMARGLALPTPPVNKRSVLIWIAFAALAAFTGVSLYRRGAGGWAWLLWGAVFSVLGAVLYHVASGGGGRGGGGSSGGGGATGSW